MTAPSSLAALADARYDGQPERRLAEFVATLRLGGDERRDMRRTTVSLMI